MLTEEEIQEFKDMVKKETGVELSNQEAGQRASQLIYLVRMMVQPSSKDGEREASAVPLWGGVKPNRTRHEMIFTLPHPLNHMIYIS